MEISILIVVVVVGLLLWSKAKMAKDIEKAFQQVEKGKPIEKNIAFHEVIGYCKKKDLDFRRIQDSIVVTYKDKTITVQQKDSYRLGSTVYFV